MSTLARNIIIGVAAVIVLAVVAVVGLGVIGGGDDVATAPATDTTVTSDTTDTVEATETTSPVTTIAPELPIAPGSIETSVQELSAECTDAVGSLRELMGRVDSGLLLDNEADFKVNDDGLAAARAGCPEAEFTQFYNLEYLGWNNGTTGFVPPATDDTPAAEESTPTETVPAG